MNPVKIIDVKESIFADNNADADRLRSELKSTDSYLVNVMSSPGSGKTTTLLGIIKELRDKLTIGVMEADIDSDVDAYTISNVGIEAIQIHTGGMCHLDADMTRQGLHEFSEPKQLVFLENVGNLVCPAEFDTGANLKMAILSIPEGDDKPLKYPLMFECVDLVVINKIDTIDYFDFKVDQCIENIHKMNPTATVLTISAKNHTGIKELADYLYAKVEAYHG